MLLRILLRDMYWTNSMEHSPLKVHSLCVRGGPLRPLHRDPQWSTCSRNYAAFCSIRRFIIVFVKNILWTMSLSSWIQSTTKHPLYLRPYLLTCYSSVYTCTFQIISSFQAFQLKFLRPSHPPMLPTCPTHINILHSEDKCVLYEITLMKILITNFLYPSVFFSERMRDKLGWAVYGTVDEQFIPWSPVAQATFSSSIFL
jgi:hypothetical protein